MVDSMVSDEEIKNIIIEGYKNILDREPDPDGLTGYTKEFKNGLSIEKFHDILKTSDEYKQKSIIHTIPDEEIKNVIIEGYKNILEREPDQEGLSSYVKRFKNGLSIEKFHDILKTSDEYRQKFISKNTITYCMMGTNRLYEIASYIETVLPYIDRLVFVDGGSTDGTIEFLNDLNEKHNNKIEIYIHEWQNRFSEQRNNCLRHFSEKQSSGWILISDTDEHYSIETLSGLRDTIKSAETEGYNGIQFQTEDIVVDDNNYNKILSRSVNDNWKPLLFKYHPDIHYEGEPSESLIGREIRWKRINLTYQHIRSQKRIYEKSVENFFISNNNRYSSKWAGFRYICTKNGILKFGDFFKLYREGTLPIEIEDWINEHKDDDNDPGDSDIRGMSKFYFGIKSDKGKNREIEKINYI